MKKLFAHARHLLIGLALVSQTDLVLANESKQQESIMSSLYKKYARSAAIAKYVTYNLATCGPRAFVHYARNTAFAPKFTDNFTVVDEGKFYRSAQPRPYPALWYRGNSFGHYLNAFKIATSINLRDNLDREPHWPQQLEAVAEHNANPDNHHVELVNIPMSSRIMPQPEKINALLEIYADPTKYPIHVNCQYGRDRTGLASALYVFEYMNQDLEAPQRLERALEQFDFIKHGHIDTDMSNMKRFICQWAELRASGATQAEAMAAYRDWYERNAT